MTMFICQNQPYNICRQKQNMHVWFNNGILHLVKKKKDGIQVDVVKISTGRALRYMVNDTNSMPYNLLQVQTKQQ